jgi:shikimate kinase
VLLIGMMGAGKSVAGAMVASRLSWPYLDSDEQVQATTGTTVAQIFATRGEAAFRAEEAAALASAVCGDGPVVVSVAGGAVLSADNRRLLREAGFVVWLRAEISTIAARIPAVAGGDHRPLLAGDRLERLQLLYGERRPHYQALADSVIDVDHLTPGEVADQVVAAYRARTSASAATTGCWWARAPDTGSWRCFPSAPARRPS